MQNHYFQFSIQGYFPYQNMKTTISIGLQLTQSGSVRLCCGINVVCWQHESFHLAALRQAIAGVAASHQNFYSSLRRRFTNHIRMEILQYSSFDNSEFNPLQPAVLQKYERANSVALFQFFLVLLSWIVHTIVMMELKGYSNLDFTPSYYCI